MAHWKDNLLLKVINIVTFLLFTGANSYGALPPFFEPQHYTYLSPEPWIYGTWGIIHTLLIGLLFYQFTEIGYHTIIEGVGWRFPLLAILTAIYGGLSNSSSHDHTFSFVLSILAFVTILFVGATVSHIYRSIKIHHPPKTLLDTVFVHIPFSLFHGFSVVLIFVAGFAAFGVDASSHPAGLFTKAFVFIALLLLEGTAAAYVFAGRGDVVGAAVISLSLLAIFQRQSIGRSGHFIHYSALAFFIISLIAVLRATIAALSGSSRITGARATDEERAPLVG